MWRKIGKKMVASLLLVATLSTGIMQGAGASDLAFGVREKEQAMMDEILNEGMAYEGMAEEVAELPGGAPVLEALPELSRESFVELSGYAEAGSDVMVYYAREGEDEVHIGEPVRAEENESGVGRFNLSLEMPDEGSYIFTAAFGKDGVWGERSNPVTTRLDWTLPLDPPSVRWELLAYDDILVTWEPAVLEDGTPDSEVESYIIYDETTNEVIAERTETFFQPDGLEAARLYRYRIASVDRAGNESYGYPITVGTSPATENKLIELYDRTSTGFTHTSVFSGDGSTVIVLDRTYVESMYLGLFAVDTETKARVLVTEAKDGEPIDGSISGFGVSHNGDIVVFASDAANLPASPVERGEHIYAYDRGTGTMELLSVPGGEASSPSISGDGRYIAYSDNERIYLHDRHTGENRLVSRGADGADENGGSASPAISGNGGIVAFVSNSTNLEDFDDAEDAQAIYVYDAVEDRIVSRHALADTHSSLAVNEDGRYIAYLESDEWGNWPSPYLLDRTTGEKLYLNGQRDEREITGKAYNHMSISADGSTVLAGLFNYDTELSGMYRFTEQFDVNDLSRPVAAGNPAMESIGAAMDATGDRIVYTRGGDLYIYCAGECGVTEPEGPIASAYWSVADGSWFQGEVKQGSRLSVQAAGEKGQRLQAVVSYKSDWGDESGGLEQIGVELPELEGASGIYRGGFEITAGMAELLSIEVRSEDGTAALALDRLPIRIAASLTVNIETDASEWLEGTRLVLSGPDESVYEAPVTPEKLGYVFAVATGTGYKLELRHDASQTVLAALEGLSFRHGESAMKVLEPEYRSAIIAKLSYSRPSSQQAVVLFRNKSDGRLLGEVTADEYGIARLEGELAAGAVLEASVVPPPGFIAPASREIQLVIGPNELPFHLQSNDSVIREVRMHYTYPRSYFDVPVMGSDAILRVNGTEGQELQAEVHFDRWNDEGELEEATRRLSLTEKEAGVYEATFHIDEGIARIRSTRIANGGEWIGDTFDIAQNVAGRVRVNLDIPDNEVWREAIRNGAIRVDWTHDIYNYYSYRMNLQPDSSQYEFDLPKDGIRYRLAVEPGYSKLKTSEITLPENIYGKTTEATLKPKFRVQMTGRATGVGNDSILGSYALKSTDGTVLLRGQNSTAFDIRLDSDAGATYKLEFTPADPLYHAEEVEVAIDRPVMQLKVELRAKNMQTIEGKVLGANGQPAGNTSITAVYEGMSRTFSAYTKSDGSYALQLPSGTAQVRAAGNGRNGYLSRLATVQVDGEGRQTVDLRLHDLAKIHLNLFTKQYGSDWQGPLEPDWRLASVFSFKPSHAVSEYGAPMKVFAAPGDTYRLCVNGGSAGLPAACAEALIGDDNEAVLELRLEGSGAQATAKFVKEDGTDAGNVRLELVRLEDGKTVHEPFTLRQQGRQYIFELSKRGQYRLQVTGGGWLTASLEFAAEAAETIDLGNVVLRKPMKFGGFGGNGFHVSAETLTQGGKLTVRALYRNAGAPASGVSDAALLMPLPQGMTLLPGSVVVNGAAAEAEIVDGRLRIDIGDVEAGAQGIVQLELIASGRDLPASLMLTGSMSYRDGEIGMEETLGTAYVGVAAVTLRMPDILSKPEFRASGTAPAGSTVYVYEGRRLLGTASASSVGTWQLDTAIQGTDARRVHIRTEAIAGGKAYVGQEAVVTYDPNDPGLYEMAVGQTGGRVHTIHPDNGVAVFPFVYVPGQPFVYKLKFRDVTRVSNVRVWTGDTAADAVLQQNGEYWATMKLEGDPGPMHVTYDTKADTAAGAGEPPSEEEARATLPGPVRNYVVEHAAGPGELGQDGRPVPADTVTATVRMTEELGARITIRSVDGSDYAPTERDAQHLARTGIPVYGSAVSISRGSQSASLTLSGHLVAESGAASRGFGSLAFGAKEFKMVVDALNMGTKIVDLDSALQTAASPQQADRLRELHQRAQELCDPRAAEYYTNMAEGIMFDALFVEYVKNALNAVGNIKLSGLEGFLFWVEGYWAGKQLDSIMDGQIAELEKYLKMNECMKKPEKPKTPPKATPKYIYDPSGYVYEGMESNRLEGVTATVLQLDEESGNWNAWDAEWYEQQNPQTTDAAGRYGWDVPPGWWKVKYEKDGYETAYSADLEVPPPHFDVNVGLVSHDAPVVTGVYAKPGGGSIEVLFSKPIKVNSITEESVRVTDAEGNPVAGSVGAVAPAAGNGGEMLAMAVVFVPEENMTAGETYAIEVGGKLSSYAGTAIEGYGPGTLTVSASDTSAPSPVEGLFGSRSGSAATLTWSDPADYDLSKLLLRWKARGDAAYGNPVEIGKGEQWATIEGLTGDKGYEFAVTALDEYGNESPEATWTLDAEDSGADWSAPTTVSDFKAATISKASVELVWRDPAAPDLAKVMIRWRAISGEADYQSGEAPVGAGKMNVTGLKPGTAYRFEAIAVDYAGNESFAATLEVTTPSDTSGPISGGGGGLPPGDPGQGEAAWTVSANGGSFEAFGGLLKLNVPRGAVNGRWQVRLERTADGDVAAPKGYVRMSPTYRLDGGAMALSGLVNLSIGYGNDDNRYDPNRFGLYRKDDGVQEGWTYVGGVLNEAAGTVEADIAELGEYAVLMKEVAFEDLTGHWSRSDVEVLASRGIIDGAGVGQFQPERLITRAELAKLLVELHRQRSGSGILPEGEANHGHVQGFADVPANAWFAPYLADAAKIGLLQGSAGLARPNDSVTREELAVMLSRFVSLTGLPAGSSAGGGDPLAGYADAAAVSGWAQDAMRQAVRRGWMKGVTAAELKPGSGATRAQAAVMLHRLLQELGWMAKRE
jgi:hypothetical protein